MEEHDLAFVMATRSTNLSAPGGVSVAELVAAQPAGRWHRRSAGTGAHGERFYDWIRIAVCCDIAGRKRWVLARRSISDGEIAYHHCFGPAATTLKTLVEVAGARWAIEECFQTAKNECGLDQYQVRKYTAWYRHITLSMAAHACLTVIRAAECARKRGLRPTGVTSW